MAIGDVRSYAFGAEGVEVALEPGNYLILAKGEFRQTGNTGDAPTGGELNLYLRRLDGSTLTLDESTVYLGLIEDTLSSGTAVLQATLELRRDMPTPAQPLPPQLPPAGYLHLQVIELEAAIHSAHLCVMEVGDITTH